MSKLHHLVQEKEVITVEIIPDRVSPADLGLLRGRVDAVTIPALRNGYDDPVYPSGFKVTPQQRSIAAATLLRGTGLDAVPTITCRDSSAVDVERLSHLASNGIENLLVVHGDPHDTPEHDRYEIRSTSRLIREILAFTSGDFSIVSITNQYAEDRDREVERSLEREEAGARVLLTNAVFEPDGILDYRDSLRSAGLSIPISVQISVIHNPDNLTFVSQKLGIPIPDGVRARLKRDPDAGVDIARAAYESLHDEFNAVHFSYLYRKRSPVPVYTRLLDRLHVPFSPGVPVELTPSNLVRK